MDIETVNQIATKLFHNLRPMMENLYERWQCENEHENINDYALPIKATIEATGAKVVAMTKRPFGVKFELDRAKFHVTVTARAYNMGSEGRLKIPNPA